MKAHPRSLVAGLLATVLALFALIVLVGVPQTPARAYNTSTHQELVEEAFRILHLPEMEALYPGVYDYYATLPTLCNAGDNPLICDIPREDQGDIDPDAPAIEAIAREAKNTDYLDNVRLKTAQALLEAQIEVSSP